MGELKSGRLGRALSLSKLGARFAVGQTKRLLAGDDGAVHRELAELLVAELGRLKGLPMKIGQLLSYMEGAVPDEHRALYQDVLSQLQRQGGAVDKDGALAVLREELGRPADEVFDRFDNTPIAAASIGQVHRAWLDGRALCVKVQYAGIAEATESDLKNIGSVVTLMRTIMPTVDTRQMIEDFRTRLGEECDYRCEATYQSRFAAIYRHDEALAIPEVVEALSSRRVLTSEFMQGVSLETFLSDATQPDRDAAGAALFRFAFGSMLQHGLFHADPHPGNLLFRAGAKNQLGVLDYGCVQPLTADARKDIATLLLDALHERPLAASLERALGIDDIDERTRGVMVTLAEQGLAPLTSAQPFRFTRDYAKSVARSMVEAKTSLATHLLSRRGRFRATRDGVMFIVRNLYGLASILGALEAEGDFRALTQTLLDGMDDS